MEDDLNAMHIYDGLLPLGYVVIVYLCSLCWHFRRPFRAVVPLGMDPDTYDAPMFLTFDDIKELYTLGGLTLVSFFFFLSMFSLLTCIFVNAGLCWRASNSSSGVVTSIQPLHLPLLCPSITRGHVSNSKLLLVSCLALYRNAFFSTLLSKVHAVMYWPFLQITILLQVVIRIALAFMAAGMDIESLSSPFNNFGVVTRLLGRWSWTWLMVNLCVFRTLVYLSLPTLRIFWVRPTKTLDVCLPSCSVVCRIDVLLL